MTWYHYPSALVPVAMAAWLRADGADRRRVVIALVGALVVAAVAIAAVVLIWGAIGLVILASRWSRPWPAVDQTGVTGSVAGSGSRSRMIASRIT